MAFLTTDTRLQRVADFFEALSPADLEHIGMYYTSTARFKDPFNEVQGLPAIRAVFAHMYVALDEPRFVVTGGMSQGTEAFLTWDFVFRFKRFDRATVQTVRGATQLRFAPDGRIEQHRDYWDAAEELYEKLPVVGGLMRWLKRQANT
ncbi:nuclear transport factor 2 family protein [Hydrogenophaga sp. OTU3427]|uniref:nuclear transport factor 2 family protein n=1 Tax=Hydrogenophaga sp. OTU3427 TaxID=3043856 RepID=UPI00313C01DA